MNSYTSLRTSRILHCAFGLLLALGFSPLCFASGLRPGDSVWEVSSRQMCGCPAPNSPLLISSYDGCSFNASNLESLKADPTAYTAARTIIYVHGNWMEWSNARDRGLILYRLLSARSCEPIRLILFSWPSEQTDRPARDVRQKADLADTHAYYLADFMNQIPSDRPLSMMGFSFGGALASGALHLMAGGMLQGRTLPVQVTHEDVRVSFVAPAFERNQMAQCGKYSLALTNVDRLVNLYNSSDPVLKRFRFIDRSGPVAAGFSGIEARVTQPLDSHPRIVQYDCSPGTGRTHFEVEYFYDCASFRHSMDNALGR